MMGGALSTLAQQGLAERLRRHGLFVTAPGTCGAMAAYPGDMEGVKGLLATLERMSATADERAGAFRFAKDAGPVLKGFVRREAVSPPFSPASADA